MLILCAAYPIILFKASTIWLFLLCMLIWGIYYDLFGFGIFDFVARYTGHDEHSSSFGIISSFRAIGSIAAPFIAAAVVTDIVGWRPFGLSLIFIAAAIIIFLILLIIFRNRKAIVPPPDIRAEKTVFTVYKLWKKIGWKLLPVLVSTLFIFLVDAVFWTLSPLYAEYVGSIHFGGIFLAAYTIPGVLAGWFVSRATKRLGKKRTAFVSLLIGSLFLFSFVWMPNLFAVVVMTFVASCFFGVALPAINGAYADYISETPIVEQEINSLGDFSFNMGYVLGPFLAGLFMDHLGISMTFTLTGALGVFLSLILLVRTPKYINIKISKEEAGG